MLAFVPQRSTWSGAGKRTNLNKDIKDIPHDSGGSTRPHFSVNKSKLSWTFFFFRSKDDSGNVCHDNYSSVRAINLPRSLPVKIPGR